MKIDRKWYSFKSSIKNNSKIVSNKIHISFIHYLNTGDQRTIQNFKYFFHFAYEPCHEEADFTIILNVNKVTFESLTTDSTIFDNSLFLNAFGEDKNLLDKFKSCSNSGYPLRNTYFVVRENKAGGDLCANVEFFKSDFWTKNKPNYKYFFFINSSARGPFLPNYWLKKW